MTLLEAYKGWGNMVQNTELYHKTKKAFADSWHILSWQHPCSYYTKEVLGEALAIPHVIESQKKSACRIMIAVLDWANFFEEDNPAPDFTVDDLMAYTRPQEVIDPTPKQQGTPSFIPPTSVITDMEEVLKVVVKPIKQEEMNTGIKQKKQVCQLDPETLEIIQTFDSISEARKELGTININRAISDVTKAGGFYWTYPEKLEEMTQAIRDKWERKREEVVNTSAPEPNDEEPNETPSKSLNKANISIILAHFTDDELIAELKLRGYTGSLSITKTVDL